MKEINVTENNDVVANVRFIIDVEHCFPSAHLCAVQLEGSKGCQILFDPHFSDTGKMAVECQSICTWLVWALPFLLHQKVKNLRAECWSGELSTRIHTQLAGGNVCWEHKDNGAPPPRAGWRRVCLALRVHLAATHKWCNERRCWYFGCVVSFALCIG